MGFPSYCERKKNLTFHEDVTIISNWFLKIHLLSFCKELRKKKQLFYILLSRMQSKLSYKITLDYGRNANPDSSNFNGQANSVPTAILNSLFDFVQWNWY